MEVLDTKAINSRQTDFDKVASTKSHFLRHNKNSRTWTLKKNTFMVSLIVLKGGQGSANPDMCIIFSKISTANYFTSIILVSWQKNCFFVLLFYLIHEASCWINYGLSVNVRHAAICKKCCRLFQITLLRNVIAMAENYLYSISVCKLRSRCLCLYSVII